MTASESGGKAEGDVFPGRQPRGGFIGAVEYGLPPVGWDPPSAPATRPSPAAQSPEELAQEGDLLWDQERFELALECYLQAVGRDSGNASYHYRTAISAQRTGRLELVGKHLTEMIRLDPHHPVGRRSLAQWSLSMGNLPAALQESAAALALAPGDPEAIVCRATVLLSARQDREAANLLESLLDSGYRSASLAETYARLSAKTGREPGAISLLYEQIQTPGAPAWQRATLHYAAAGLLDRIGLYDAAFEQARLANEASRRPHDPLASSRGIDRQIEYFTADRLDGLPRASHGSRRPVFIIGMHRSGTTLVEQILASHPQVHGAGELQTIGLMAGRLAAQNRSAAGYPECLDALSLRAANRLAGEYLSVLHAAHPSATYVTDKMPTNFLYLGLIRRLFPDCHVIHCTRDPRDTCLSCYFTPFVLGEAYKYDLRHVASFYRDYCRLMRHWNDVNIPMLEVRYEDSVEDLEGQTRRMLEFLGLPWDPQCLEFHRNSRYVGTASRDQVCRPIYRSSIGRWKNYSRHLAALIDDLGPDGCAGSVAMPLQATCMP